MRIAHGSLVSFNPVSGPSDQPPAISRFDYLFPDLAEDPGSLLPVSEETLANLARLGDTMRDPGIDLRELNAANVHSGYTYLGQFIDHDIVFTAIPEPREPADPCNLGDTLPWPPACIRKDVWNKRTAILELETIYGGSDVNPPPRDPADNRLMLLGRVPGSGLMSVEEELHDLPLTEQSVMSGRRDPWIGDKRNDQTLIISQLHVAFLRAHNAIVKRRNCSFDEARRLLTQHYHWMVIHDFLDRKIAPGAFAKVKPNPRYIPEQKFFLPLEFTVAAFRFGHTMIRNTYYLNSELPIANLKDLFTLKALSNSGGSPTLPRKRIIDWKEFLPGGNNIARRFDTRMVEPLREILDAEENPVPGETRLAVQDLRRGYFMSIPTGQAIANKLGITPLTENDFRDACVADLQFQVLKESGFIERTPLWFYILAEAFLAGGNQLGPVGGQLVAEVLVGLVRRISYSFLNDETWKPTLGIVPGDFTLKDLFKLAGVLPD